MNAYRGLTWDHPRGRVWLEAASVLWRERGIDVTWDAQPLEGFEAHPIDDLADRYDLIVLDHPHVGDALATGSLQSIESVLGAGDPLFSTGYVGPTLASYQNAGETWALPIDAATQVSARDARVVAEAPETWGDVAALAGHQPVALSLAGPHALISLFSVAAALGAPPVDAPGASWVPDRVALEALDLLRAVHAHARPEYAELNPIGLLERVGSDDPLAYVPLVFGYVNYSLPDRVIPVAFGAAPAATPGGTPGSTIGGTSVAISRRADITDSLRAYLRWLVAPATQRRIVPEFAGQPAASAAWSDAEVDTAAARFYSATRSTIETSVVRPRYAGFPESQLTGSAIVRAALAAELSPSDAVSALADLARRSREPVVEGRS